MIHKACVACCFFDEVVLNQTDIDLEESQPMQTKFADFILNASNRVAFTIGVYAGLEITGQSVQVAVSDAAVQAEAAWVLHRRFNTPVLLTAMDLSVEAELFGCQIRFEEGEIPTVIGRRATNAAEIEALPRPRVDAGRAIVNLDVTASLVKQGGAAPVLGGMIGPFSLAGRIFGVSEALEASALEPTLMHSLLEQVTDFLTDYALAFRNAGATGVVMAEPLAGLLSPRGLGKFSAPYVRRIAEAVQTEDFSLVLHNCGARLVHLPQVLQSGVEVYHFGAPMDILSALQQVDGSVVLGGNLDPTAVFHNGDPASVRRQTTALLAQTQPYKNFVLSSGCDIPPGTPIENIAAFYTTVQTS